MTSPFHPDLARARFIPRFSFTPWLVRLMNRRTPRGVTPPPTVTVKEIWLTDTVVEHVHALRLTDHQLRVGRVNPAAAGFHLRLLVVLRGTYSDART